MVASRYLLVPPPLRHDHEDSSEIMTFRHPALGRPTTNFAAVIRDNAVTTRDDDEAETTGCHTVAARLGVLVPNSVQRLVGDLTGRSYLRLHLSRKDR